MNQGIKYLNAPETGVLMAVEPVVSTAFGAIYLGEPLSGRFVIGAGLIFVCGVFLILLPIKSSDVD
jgi:drug/metabolite transporter (DMT)-like permease